MILRGDYGNDSLSAPGVAVPVDADGSYGDDSITGANDGSFDPWTGASTELDNVFWDVENIRGGPVFFNNFETSVGSVWFVGPSL